MELTYWLKKEWEICFHTISQNQCMGNSTGQTRFLQQTNKQTARKVREILKSKKDPSTKCNVLTWIGSYNTYEIRKFEHWSNIWWYWGLTVDFLRHDAALCVVFFKECLIFWDTNWNTCGWDNVWISSQNNSIGNWGVGQRGYGKSRNGHVLKFVEARWQEYVSSLY